MLQAKPAGRERFAKRKNRGKGPNLEVPTEPMSRDSGSAKSSSPCALAFAEDSQRERLARRKQKSQRGARSEAASPSLFAAAATSLVQFQQLFNLTQSRNSEDEDECFSIWGPDDTPAHYEERLLALEKARSEQAAARVPHHHAARAKRKPEVKAGTQVVPKVDDAKQAPFNHQPCARLDELGWRCCAMPEAAQGQAMNRDAMAASGGSFKGSGKLKTVGLDGSRGEPLMMRTESKTQGRVASRTPVPPSKDVTPEQLHLFLFPSSLEHPESTGRLEIFARYGPVDEAGKLRGGISGSHVHTDLELRQMIHHETREMLFTLFKKPRETVEVIVDGLLPAAMVYNYTWQEVKQLLKPCFQEMGSNGGKLSFARMQKIILQNQRERLQALLKDKNAALKERGPKVPFQSKPQHVLLAPISKKDLNAQEEQHWRRTRLQRFATQVAEMEDQNLQNQVVSNVILCRNPGDVDDRWDRYCAVRRVGKATYVKARNQQHSGFASMDDGLSNKHPGVSSLTSTGYLKGPVL
ncbi:unnamed protein product [Effrenium voratum]|nr:unnamed protein product [Effrenium voratum]